MGILRAHTGAIGCIVVTYSTSMMNPGNAHKLMGFFILGIILLYTVSAFLKLFRAYSGYVRHGVPISLWEFIWRFYY